MLDYDPDISAAFRVIPAGPAPDLWPLFDALAAGGRPLLLVRGATSDLLESKRPPRCAAARRR